MRVRLIIEAGLRGSGMATTDDNEVFQRIKQFLDTAEVSYEMREHAPTFTSAQSAAARGEDLSTGAKALLIKCDGDFRLFVIPADRTLDSKAAKKSLGIRKMRFATKEELLDKTGLVPGAVPPFGEPVLPFPLHIDQQLNQNERVAFNAGMLTRSIIISGADYARVAGGRTGTFATS
ncbi:MAG: hypothetical protein MK110_15185 [Fuerstiella sp.]|nr:hypothetical protein [Fuerstiella sp.]